MANLNGLLVSNISNFLAPILVAVHTADSLNL